MPEVFIYLFIDAVVEADTRRLSKVAVIRLGAPYTEVEDYFIDYCVN